MAGKGVRRAPYRKGSLMDWTSYEINSVSTADPPGWGAPDEWRDNVPVAMSLKLTGMERGRSAARFVWVNGRDEKFPMFMTDIADLVISHGHRIGVGGLVRGSWIVKKRGANYGIALLTEDGEK